MVNGIRRAVAGVGAGLILLGSTLIAPLASAQTFSDVPTTHWGYTYVEDGVAKGFFDAATNFYPDRNLNRAELAKLVFKVAKYAGIVTDIDTSGAPVFTDVPSNEWYYPYVATVTKANLLSGYKDGNGNPTGKYGPGDLVTRSQAAKAFINAGGVANKTAPVAPFVDLVAGSWYMDYVSTAYNWSIIDGYSGGNGLFGPNDPVTRAQIAKIISNALNPVDRQGGNANVNGTTNGNANNANANTSIPKAGTLDVALSSNTPPAAIIPQNTTAAKYLAIKLTAGATNDISLNTLTVTRTGLGDRNDFSKIWAEVDGARVSGRQSVGTDDKATLTFSPMYVVKAGTTVEMFIVAQMNNPGGGKYNALVVSASSDVNSSAQNLTGTFPITGNTMQTATYNVTQVSFAEQGANTTYKVGDTNVELKKFKLTNDSDSKAVVFKKVMLKNLQTAPWSDFTNIAMYVGSTNVVPSASVTTNGDYITFNLGAGRTINYGQSETYTIRGDVVGVDNVGGDALQTQVRYIEDLEAFEVTTGFGVAPNPAASWTAAPLVTYNINGGTFILSKASTSPTTQTVPINTSDVTFLIADAKIGQAFQAEGATAYLCFDQDTTLPGGGTAANAAAAIDNLRLYQGSTIVASLSFNATDLTAAPGACSNADATRYSFPFDSTVTFNTTTQLKIVGNVTNNALEHYQFAFSLENNLFTAWAPEYLSSGNQVQAGDIIGAATGNPATVGRAALTVSRVDGFGAKDVVAGVTNYTVAKFRLQTDDISAVNIAGLKLNNPVGTANENFMPTMRLYKGTDTTALQEVNFTSGTADFNAINLSLPANSSMDLTVTLDTNSGVFTGAPPPGDWFQLGVSYIDAKDPNNNDAKVNGAYPYGYPLAQSAVFTFIQSGILTYAADANRPTGAILVAGTTDGPVGKFKLSATKDDVDVTDLYFYNSDDTAPADPFNPTEVELLSLNGRVNAATLTWDGQTTPVMGQLLPSTNKTEVVVRFHMAGGELVIPKDGNKVVTVKLTLNPVTAVNESGMIINLYGGATTIQNFGYAAGTQKGVRALTHATGAELVAASIAVSADTKTNLFVIRKTKPTFVLTGADGTLLTGNDREIMRFTVSAASNADVDLAQLTFSFTQSANVQATGMYIVEDGSNTHLNNALIATSAPGADENWTFLLDHNSPASGVTVSAGTTKTFVLKGIIADTAVAGTSSLSTQIIAETSGTYETNTWGALAAHQLSWSDTSDPSHTWATADYTNGILINELPLNSRTYTYAH